MPRQIRSTANRLFFPLHVWGPLTHAEARLLHSLAKYEPAIADDWHARATILPGRALRATIVRDLCLSATVARCLHGGRIQIRDAVIDEVLDLSFAHLPFPLEFVGCRVSRPILLNHAHLAHLAFRNCSLNGVQANGTVIGGDVVFSGRTRARGGISLERSRIDGKLLLSGAWIKNVGGSALNCGSATIGGAVDLDKGFSCIGEVNLYNARVRGDITLDSARITNRGGFSIHADLAKSDGGIFIRQAKIRGEIRMRGVECRSNLEFDGTSVEAVSGSPNAIALDQARIDGSLYLRDRFRAIGKVVVLGSLIGVDLDVDGAVIQGAGRGRKALVASRVRVQGSVFLYRLQAAGEVILAGAYVGGNILWKGTTLTVHRSTPADKPRGTTSLNAKSVTVRGSVELRRGGSNALLDFRSARIGRNLEVRQVEFAKGRITGLLLENARVRGEFSWVDTVCHSGTKMVLSHAHFGRFRHGRSSWPEKDLHLRGCVYAAIDFDERAKPGAASMPTGTGGKTGFVRLWSSAIRFLSIGEERSDAIDWLGRQKPGKFDPQPYEQLSGVLQRSGHDDEAKQVAIAMEKARSDHTTDPVTKALSRMQGVFVEHGHSTRRLWVLSLLWVLMTAVWFGQAKRAEVMTTANEEVFLDASYARDRVEPKEYPQFNAVVYSLDAFLPIIDLRQEAYWMPNAKLACVVAGTELRVSPCGGLFRLYHWIHILLGWLATTLMVFSVTGLIRHQRSTT